MATTKEAKAAREAKQAASQKARAKATKEQDAELEAKAAARQAEQDSFIEQRPKVKADPSGNIDQRMQALLEDHQRMGARPK